MTLLIECVVCVYICDVSYCCWSYSARWKEVIIHSELFPHCNIIVKGPKTSMAQAKIIIRMSWIFWHLVSAVNLRWQIAGSRSTLIIPKTAPATDITLSSLSATKSTTMTVMITTQLRRALTAQYSQVDSFVLKDYLISWLLELSAL